jgi:hypothetical protein
LWIPLLNFPVKHQLFPLGVDAPDVKEHYLYPLGSCPREVCDLSFRPDFVPLGIRAICATDSRIAICSISGPLSTGPILQSVRVS